jgi:hypothetical protein
MNLMELKENFFVGLQQVKIRNLKGLMDMIANIIVGR